MSAVDGQDLFASGPHSVRPEPWERALRRRGFAGVDGELVLDLGLRSRRVVQTGRLQAPTAQGVCALVGQIEAVADGRTHTLIDGTGCSYIPVIVEEFAPTTPVRRGRGFWCDYRITYRQLP